MSMYINEEIKQMASSDLTTLILNASSKMLEEFSRRENKTQMVINTSLVIAYASATARHYGGYLNGSFKRILVDIMNDVFKSDSEITVELALSLWSDVVNNTSVCRNLEVCQINHLLEKYGLI